MSVLLINSLFRIPKKEFYERMSINRQYIKKLPGFMEDGFMNTQITMAI